jgi:hypothetical protein
MLLLSAGPVNASLSAGAGKAFIAPLPYFPEVSLAGFGAREPKPAQGVHDELFSRALVLSDGETKVALVSTDLLLITPVMKEAVLAKVADLGFTDDTLLLAAIHTHSGPGSLTPGSDARSATTGKYNPALMDWMTTRIAESIRAANEALQPAQLGFAAARIEGLSHNRRQTGEGLLDSTMTVMKVVRAGAPDARPIAVVVNFAAHATIMGAKNLLYTADWPGAMNAALELWLGKGGVSLFFNGAQGDQTHAGDFGSGWERVAAYGNAVAKEAWKLAPDITMSSDVRIRAHSINWDLPQLRPSPVFMESTARESGMTAQQAQERLRARFPRRVRLQAIRIGDGVLMAVPGEAISELGLEMRANAAALGAKYPMVIGLANNYIGYILSPKQYGLGGYEVGTSFYGPQLGAILVAQMKEAVRPLFAE